ncbi:MAG: nucleotide exchange factor GrpE [Pararhodobacter sp.]|nr:nucleotide exchange factor GrpE [Pararhodobacter sp.]
MAQPQNTENQDLSEPQTEPQTDAEPLDAAAALEEAHAAFEIERAEMRDRLMRALADLENTRKRGEKDRREAAIYGGAKLARDLIPVYDNLSRAMSVTTDDTRKQAQGLVEGVELTLRELLSVLGKHGVERVSPQAGEMFDPHLHEAMFEAPIPNTRAGQIIQVMSDGFRMHEQLLRPAQVGVSSTPG